MFMNLVGKSFRIIQAWLLGSIFRNDQLTFPTVGDFVSVKSSKNHKAQQRSTSSVQQVQYQSLKNNKFQQSSTGF